MMGILLESRKVNQPFEIQFQLSRAALHNVIKTHMDYDGIDVHVLVLCIRKLSNAIYTSSGIGHCFCTRESHISYHGAAQNHAW